MKKLKELLSENKSSKTVKDFKFSKDELEFLQALINGVGSGQHPYADMGSIGGFKIEYVNQLMKKVKNKVPTKWKSLYNKVSTKLQETNIKEAKMKKLKELLPENTSVKINEADAPSKSDIANSEKRKSQGLLPLWWPDYGDGNVDKTYYDKKSQGFLATWWKLKDKYVDTKFSPNDEVFRNAYKIGTLPKSMVAQDKLDVALPAPVEKFLNRLIGQIKGYNLSRNKETVVIAKIISAMGMDKDDVMRAISKIKRAGVLETNNEKKKLNEEEIDIKPGFKFFELEYGYTESGRGTISNIWEVTKELGNDKFECKLISTSGMGRTGYKESFTKSKINDLATKTKMY